MSGLCDSKYILEPFFPLYVIFCKQNRAIIMKYLEIIGIWGSIVVGGSIIYLMYRLG